MIPVENLSFIAAPMVNQSDMPFRALTRKYGATLTYTQMLSADKLLNDQDYLEFHQRDLTRSADGIERPVVVQLCGNDPELVVKAGKKLQGYCDAIGDPLDLNLGCPQDHAREDHYGGYLLGRKDWPLIQDIVSSMSKLLSVPVSAKIRLCQNTPDTVNLGELLEASGASWVTLHARHVSAKRRRQGAADLHEVKRLKEKLRVPVISNGNVRTWDDLIENRKYTGADGCMVGETLLGNPCLFANVVPDPVRISLEYLEICKLHSETASLHAIQAHVRHFVEHQCVRRPWFQKFRKNLTHCDNVEDIEALLLTKVSRWRGKAGQVAIKDGDAATDTSDYEDDCSNEDASYVDPSLWQ
ncbi:FMN-linked oxidoreductase [Leucogyrophana mollusca]|uniref:FMN-linked oxidoreductase n=1 Tax=Leucogyrophana mollusca TaxID=85980 RepID=A0ACB8BU79_9AGAM|nr:FMN-linked oxidoreductase [Leucogyrophana mollusca]